LQKKGEIKQKKKRKKNLELNLRAKVKNRLRKKNLKLSRGGYYGFFEYATAASKI
jgi:hypothetical protein